MGGFLELRQRTTVSLTCFLEQTTILTLVRGEAAWLYMVRMVLTVPFTI